MMSDKQIRLLTGILDRHNSRAYCRTYAQPEFRHPPIQCKCEDCNAIRKVLKLDGIVPVVHPVEDRPAARADA